MKSIFIRCALAALFSAALGISACKKDTPHVEVPIERVRGWYETGSNSSAYSMGLQKGEGPDGGDAITIQSVLKDSIKGFGAFMKSSEPGPSSMLEQFRGKRVKMSAQVKSNSITGWAGLWVRVDAATEEEGEYAFDNMGDRPVKGTTGWTTYDLVLDVDTAGKRLVWGILMSGTGQVWITEPVFTVVDSSVKTTAHPIIVPKEPVNLEFEPDTSGTHPKNWWLSGNRAKDYTLETHVAGGPSGKNAVVLKSNVAEIKGAGIFSQTCRALNYSNKRVKISAMIKTRDAAEGASMFFRVNGHNNDARPLAMDTMRGRIIKGTSNWRRDELVLDVSSFARDIVYGAMLRGTGELWISDMKIEVVAKSVRLTGGMPRE